MGGYDGVGGVQQGVIGGQRRLGLEHIDAGTAQLPGMQGLSQGRGVDHRPARRVDEDGPPFDAAERLRADEAPRALVQRAMQA